MQKEKFNNFITEPRKNIDSISIEEIELLQQKFPYCEIINHMSLLKAHVDNDVNFNEVLLKTSVYASDRKNIFYLINPAVKIKQAIHETKNTYDFDFVISSFGGLRLISFGKIWRTHTNFCLRITIKKVPQMPRKFLQISFSLNDYSNMLIFF